ncbi:uncharacterized protein KZ484_021550 [Pholidichthys leucotaenia]
MSCVAVKCKNRFFKSQGRLQFFRFPKDELRRKQWIDNVRRKDWTPTPSSRLCSEHFEERHITVDAMRNRRLKDTAVPTIFPTHIVTQSLFYPDIKEEPLDDLAISAARSNIVISSISSRGNIFPPTSNIVISAFSTNGEIPATDSDSICVDENASVKNGICRDDDTFRDDDSCWDDDTFRDPATLTEHVTRDHRYAAPEEVSAIREYHSYTVESLRSLQLKNERMQEMIKRHRKMMKTQNQKVRRLKKKVRTLKDTTKDLRKRLLILTERAPLIESSSDIPQDILDMLQKAKKTSQYPEELKQFAATLLCHSPKVYQYVRERFHRALLHGHSVLAWDTAVSGHLKSTAVLSE